MANHNIPTNCYSDFHLNGKGVSCKGNPFYPIYMSWAGMQQRCNNSNANNYSRYGAKGVTICEEWNESITFIKWALDNGWKEGLTLERINSKGNYSPDNCRWATAKEQGRNTSRNKLIEINGEILCLAEAVEKYDSLGLGYHNIKLRLRRGYSVDQAFNISKKSHSGKRLI